VSPALLELLLLLGLFMGDTLTSDLKSIADLLVVQPSFPTPQSPSTTMSATLVNALPVIVPLYPLLINAAPALAEWSRAARVLGITKLPTCSSNHVCPIFPFVHLKSLHPHPHDPPLSHSYPLSNISPPIRSLQGEKYKTGCSKTSRQACS